MKTALVSFSGGQDSTTCLFWALNHYDRVHTIGFDYGQKNHVELSCRKSILQKIYSQFPQYAEKLASDVVVNIRSFGQIAQSALTGNDQTMGEISENGLPNSFVPGRNLVFLTYAAARAYLINAQTIVAGMGQTDFSGYPDCRRNTMDALQNALTLGLDRSIEITTPLMFLTKAQTWELAEMLGGKTLVDFIVENTHTCYEGDHQHFHEWGYGCGGCPACQLRDKGWKEYLARKKR